MTEKSGRSKKFDAAQHEAKLNFLKKRGHFLAAIYRKAIDAAVITEFQSGNATLEELEQAGIDLSTCLKNAPTTSIIESKVGVIPLGTEIELLEKHVEAVRNALRDLRAVYDNIDQGAEAKAKMSQHLASEIVRLAPRIRAHDHAGLKAGHICGQSHGKLSQSELIEFIMGKKSVSMEEALEYVNSRI